MRAFVPALALVFFSGCTSLVQQFVPGEPVTAERCQKMDLKQMGLKDGEIGQRRGDKFDFWAKDCRMSGAPLNADPYNQGYDEGLKIYCSCEKGFDSGVRDEFAETRGQYYVCTRPEFALFLKGHEAGKKFLQDPTMVRKDGPYKFSYFDDVIMAKAKEECVSLQKSPGSPTESK